MSDFKVLQDYRIRDIEASIERINKELVIYRKSGYSEEDFIRFKALRRMERLRDKLEFLQEDLEDVKKWSSDKKLMVHQYIHRELSSE